MCSSRVALDNESPSRRMRASAARAFCCTTVCRAFFGAEYRRRGLLCPARGFFPPLRCELALDDRVFFVSLFCPNLRDLRFIGPPSFGGPVWFVAALQPCDCKLENDHSARIVRARHERLIDACRLESNGFREKRLISRLCEEIDQQVRKIL